MTERAGSPIRTMAVVAGVTVIATGLYVTAVSLSRRLEPSRLDEPARAGHWEDRELQVVVHDLVESLEPGTAVAVCRGLATVRLSLSVSPGATLGDALEQAADRAGADLLGPRDTLETTIATLACPDGRGDYLRIGQP